MALAKTFSRYYFDLKQAEDRLRLDLNWDSLARSGETLILDEAQVMSDIFPKIWGAIQLLKTTYSKNGGTR